MAATAAIGATALLASSAQAASFEVNSTRDHAADACQTFAVNETDCTLRDAITAANANTEADTITFASGLTGTIELTDGALPISGSDGLTIDGPGADALKVSGAGTSRILEISGDGPVEVRSLTLTDGYQDGDGGAVNAAAGSDVTLTGAAITDSHATGGGGGVWSEGALTVVDSSLTGNRGDFSGGGAIFHTGHGSQAVTITGSTISGNTGDSGAGMYARAGCCGPGDAGGGVTIDDSTISGNTAQEDGGAVFTAVPLTMKSSTVSGNRALHGSGGGVYAGKYGAYVGDSTLSGNSASRGGGLAVNSYSDFGFDAAFPSYVMRTTVSGNHADDEGPGIVVLAADKGVTVDHSTISGNDGGPDSFGGGIALSGAGRALYGAVEVSDSTVSGNSAHTGGGVSVGDSAGAPDVGPDGSIDFDNSTIASNSASANGGGVYLGRYESQETAPEGTSGSPTVSLTSTIVADNQADGAAQDADRAEGSTDGGLDVAYTLVEHPGDAPLFTSHPGTSLTGIDPALGALADNGGPTKTQLPSPTSPVIDKGKAPARLTTDQRGDDRTIEGDAADAPAGDGTDIGSVEVQNPAHNPPNSEPEEPQPQIIIRQQPTETDRRPLAVIRKNRLKNPNKRFVRGRAYDDHGVVRVRVAIVKVVHGRCRVLKRSGDFGHLKRCGRTHTLLKADGTTRWKFRLRKPLKRGRYVVYSRAIDDAGQRQYLFGRKSRRSFHVHKR